MDKNTVAGGFFGGFLLISAVVKKDEDLHTHFEPAQTIRVETVKIYGEMKVHTALNVYNMMK